MMIETPSENEPWMRNGLSIVESTFRSSFLRSMHRHLRKRWQHFYKHPKLAERYFNIDIHTAPLYIRFPKPQPRVFEVDMYVESPHGIGRVVKLLKHRTYVVMTPSGSHSVIHEDLRRSRRPPASINYEVGDLVEVARRTWPGINKQGGTARIKAKREDGKYDVMFTLSNTQERGLDAIFLQPAVFRSRSDKREVCGRCRVPNCPSFIRDCCHVQPDEFADILIEKIAKQKSKPQKTEPAPSTKIAKKNAPTIKHRKVIQSIMLINISQAAPSRRRDQNGNLSFHNHIDAARSTDVIENTQDASSIIIDVDDANVSSKPRAAMSFKGMSLSDLLSEMRRCTEVLIEATRKSRSVSENIETILSTTWPKGECERNIVLDEYEKVKSDYESMRLQTEWEGVDAFNYAFSIVRKHRSKLSAYEKTQRSLLDLQHTALNVEWREVDAATMKLLIRLRQQVREYYKDVELASDDEEETSILPPITTASMLSNHRSTAPSYENRYAGDRLAGAKRKRNIASRQRNVDQHNHPSMHRSLSKDHANESVGARNREDINDFIASDDDFEHWIDKKYKMDVSFDQLLPERAASNIMDVLAEGHPLPKSGFQYEHVSNVQFDHDMEIAERVAEAKKLCETHELNSDKCVLTDIIRDIESADATETLNYYYDLLESMWVNNALTSDSAITTFISEYIQLVLRNAIRDFLVDSSQDSTANHLFISLNRMTAWLQMINPQSNQCHKDTLCVCTQLIWSFACGCAMATPTLLTRHVAAHSTGVTSSLAEVVPLWLRLTDISFKLDNGESSWSYFRSALYECIAWKYAGADRFNHPAIVRAKMIMATIKKSLPLSTLVMVPLSTLSSVTDVAKVENYLSSSFWTLIAFHNYALKTIMTKDETLPKHLRLKGDWQMIEFVTSKLTSRVSLSQWLSRTAQLSRLWENTNKPVDIFISSMSQFAQTSKWPKLNNGEVADHIESDLMRLINRKLLGDIDQDWLLKHIFISHQLAPLIVSECQSADVPLALSRIDCLASLLNSFQDLLGNCLHDVPAGSVQHRRLKLRLNAANGLISICPTKCNFTARLVLLFALQACSFHFELASFMSIDLFDKVNLLMCDDNNILLMSSEECSCLKWIYVTKIVIPILSMATSENKKIIDVCIECTRNLCTDVYRQVMDEVSCILVPSNRTRNHWMFVLLCISSLVRQCKPHHVLILQNFWHTMFSFVEFQLDKQIGYAEGVFTRLSIQILDDVAVLYWNCMRDNTMDIHTKSSIIRPLVGQIQRLLPLTRKLLNDSVDLINEDVIVTHSQPAWSVALQICHIFASVIKTLHIIDSCIVAPKREVKMSWTMQLSNALDAIGQIPCIAETSIDSWLKCALWAHLLEDSTSMTLHSMLTTEYLRSMTSAWVGCILSSIMQPQVFLDIRLQMLQKTIFSRDVLRIVPSFAPLLAVVLNDCCQNLPDVDVTSSRFEQSISANERQCLKAIKTLLSSSATATYNGYKSGQFMLQQCYVETSAMVAVILRVLRSFQLVCNKLSTSTRTAVQRIIQEVASLLCGPFLFACSAEVATEIYDILVLPAIQSLMNYASSTQQRNQYALLQYDIPENGQYFLLKLSMYMRGIALSRFSTRFICWTPIIDLLICSRRCSTAFREKIIIRIAESLQQTQYVTNAVYPYEYEEKKHAQITNSNNTTVDEDAFVMHQQQSLCELCKYILNEDKLWDAKDNQSSACCARVDLIAYYVSIPVINCSNISTSFANSLYVPQPASIASLVTVNAICYLRLIRLYMGEALINIFGYHEKEDVVIKCFRQCIYNIIGTTVTLIRHCSDIPLFETWRLFARAAHTQLRYIHKMSVGDVMRLIKCGKQLLQDACLHSGCDCVPNKRLGSMCRAGYLYNHLREHLSFAKDTAKHMASQHKDLDKTVQVRKIVDEWLTQQFDNLRVELAPAQES